MKKQCFLVRKDRRGRGVTVPSRDKRECRAGVAGGGECRKMVANVLLLATCARLSRPHSAF